MARKRGFHWRDKVDRDARRKRGVALGPYNREGCGSEKMHGPHVCSYGPDGICSGHFDPGPWSLSEPKKGK